MAGDHHPLSAQAFPAIVQLALRTRRWLHIQHCLKQLEAALWWCATLLAAGAVVHHSVTALTPAAIIALGVAPLAAALLLGLLTGRVSLIEAAEHCDRRLGCKQLYLTALEYLSDTQRPRHLAVNYVLTQAEQLARQWLPKVREMQRYRPSPWLTIPLGICLAALFFQALPGKQQPLPQPIALRTETLTTPATTAEQNLVSRLETAFNQIERRQLEAEKATATDKPLQNNTSAVSNDIALASETTASQPQRQTTQQDAQTAAALPLAGQSNASGGHSTQRGDAEDDSGDKQPPQTLTDPQLQISYYELKIGNRSGTGQTATGATRELVSSASNATTAHATAIASELLPNDAPRYASQLSLRQRQYLNTYFKTLKAEE
jgi:hypothetical protein